MTMTNSMMTGFLFAGATALILLYVLLPLVRRGGRGHALPGLTESPAGTRLRAIEEQRTLTIEALRDLEFEYRLGNLTDDDYLRLKERYTRRAIALVQQAEAADKALDDDIETAIRALRSSAPLRAAALPRPGAACAGCGRTLGPDDRFCPSCGRPVVTVQAPVYRNGHARTLTTAVPAPAPVPAGSAPVAGRPGVRRWALASGVAAVVFAFSVAAAYVALRPTAGAPTPVGQVSVNHVHSLLVMAGATPTVLLGHHDGLYRSDDGGTTWTAVAGLPPGGDVMGLVNHPAAASTVIVAGHNVLMRSLDGGATFTPLQSDLPSTDIHALTGHPDNPQRLYAYVADRGLFRSDDGGTAWTQVSDRLPSSTGALAVMSGPGGDLVFAATQGSGMLLSTDGGRSWASASGFVNGALPTRQIYAVAVDPRSGDRFSAGGGARFSGAVYAGTDAGLFKSTDGGQSWNRLPLETDVAALALDPADTRSIIAANRKGQVFRSPDRGITWRPR